MRGPRHFKAVCINAVCGWVGARIGDNRTEAEKKGCPKCHGPVVAQKK